MNFADYFDTPEQAVEAKQQMLSLGWMFYGEGGGAFRRMDRNPYFTAAIYPEMTAAGGREWFTYHPDLHEVTFYDPVSCAVALELVK